MGRIWGRIASPVKAYTDFGALYMEFMARQSRNVDNLPQSGDALVIKGPTTHSFLPTEFYPCAYSGASGRTAPSEIFLPHRPRLPEPIALPITLTHPVAAGQDKPSQVWRATTKEGSIVLVKILTAFLGSDPDWSCNNLATGDGRVTDFVPDEELAHREAWAYQKLEDLQGGCIPHSYGFYDVSHQFLPCCNHFLTWRSFFSPRVI
jgi:hypothetical protein